MPEKVQMWGRDEVTERVWGILDELKSLDEEIIKEWVRNTWPSPEEVYE